MSHKEGLTHMDRIHIRLKNRVRFLNRVMYNVCVEEDDYVLFDSIMNEDCHKTYVTIRFMEGITLFQNKCRWIALMIKGKPYLVSKSLCMSLRTKENRGKIDMGYIDLVKVEKQENEEDEISVLREEIEDLKEAVDLNLKSITTCNEMIDMSEIENEKLKAVVITKDNDIMLIKEELRQETERSTLMNARVTELEEENARTQEEIVATREELKRKRENDDIPNAHVEPDNDNMNEDTDTKECTVCEKARPLSSFRTKINKKNKEDKLVSYTIIRDMCNTCKSARSRENKKAKISK